MRWLLMLLMSTLLMWSAAGCVFSDEDGTPDSVIIEDNDPPASNTTIIEDVDPPAADADIDVNVDGTL